MLKTVKIMGEVLVMTCAVLLVPAIGLYLFTKPPSYSCGVSAALAVIMFMVVVWQLRRGGDTYALVAMMTMVLSVAHCVAYFYLFA